MIFAADKWEIRSSVWEVNTTHSLPERDNFLTTDFPRQVMLGSTVLVFLVFLQRQFHYPFSQGNCESCFSFVKLKLIESVLLQFCSKQQRLVDFITVNKCFSKPTAKHYKSKALSAPPISYFSTCKLEKNPKTPNPNQKNKF